MPIRARLVRSLTCLSLAVAASAGVGCGTAPTGTLLTTGVIAGRVFDKASQAGVADVTVTVAGTALSGRTDASGAFSIDHVPPGHQALIIGAPKAYMAASSAIATDVQANSASGVDVALGTDAPPTATPIDTTGLTAEEAAFVLDGSLPDNYATLKATAASKGLDAARAIVRAGMQGPFTDEFGDPNSMLALARRVKRIPEMGRLARDVRRGDIAIVTYNNPDEFISMMTHGPFTHALLCTKAGPVPQYIEAIGLTGRAGDPSSNKVRRSSSLVGETITVRVLHPTAGMDPAKAEVAIDRAVHYAETKLGKPYNYSFSDKTANGNAFYCSQLTYLAYADPQGADMDLHLNKSADRDKMLDALTAVMTGMQPDDPATLAHETIDLVRRDPKPTGAEFAAFLVDNVLMHCKTTHGIVTTDEERTRLKTTIDTIMAGQAYPRFEAATRAYHDADDAHDFNQPVLGGIKRKLAETHISEAFLADNLTLLHRSDIHTFAAIGALKTVTVAVLPYSELIAGYLYGPHSDQAQRASHLLDLLDRIKAKAPHIPLLGTLAANDLPGRARPLIDRDFVSPTDLAWADEPHNDYNVQPNHPIDKPTP